MIDEKTQKQVEDLFHKGCGGAAISVALKIPQFKVDKHLRERGLKRTKEEARLAKMKAFLDAKVLKEAESFDAV